MEFVKKASKLIYHVGKIALNRQKTDYAMKLKMENVILIVTQV